MTAHNPRYPWQKSRILTLNHCYEALGKTEDDARHMLSLVLLQFPIKLIRLVCRRKSHRKLV